MVLRFDVPSLFCRSPHGERGLKFPVPVWVNAYARSLSSWRAWIEISARYTDIVNLKVALLMESVD